jgi:hypothetical protein
MSKGSKEDAAAMLVGIAGRQSQRGSEQSEGDAQRAGKPESGQANKQTSKLASLQVVGDERPTTFSTYLKPSLQKRIKRLALESDKTTASLIEEAVNALLEKHGG